MPQLLFQGRPDATLAAPTPPTEPEPDYVLIPYHHPVSLYFYHADPLTLGGHAFKTLMACYCAIYLAQHNMTAEARGLLSDQWSNDRKFDATTSEQLVDRLVEERNVITNPQFILNRDEILYSILRESYDSHAVNNSFRSFCDSFLQHFDPDRTVFVNVGHGKDRLLTCGLSKNICVSAAASSVPEHRSILRYCQGNDIASRCLHRLFTSLRDAHCSNVPKFSVADLLTRFALDPLPQHSRTVALVSDSMFGYTSYVEGGAALYRGGLTCTGLVTALSYNCVHLAQYRILIFCIGTNDAHNLVPSDWSSSLDDLVALLQPFVGDPSFVVILNSGIGLKKWPETPDYTKWFSEHLRCSLLDRSVPNFHFVDWSQPGPSNPFMNSQREPNPELINPDGRHPNARGLNCMLKSWIKICPEIGNVTICFDDTQWKYPLGKLPVPP